MRGRNAILALALLVALAGCSDSGSAPASSALDVEEVETQASLGAITGVVVDPSIKPVAGAEVRLVQTDQTRTTEEDGRFVFQDLQPGFYTLEIAAQRYLATQTTAEVAAGAPTPVKAQIVPDTRPEPFHVTDKFQGIIALGDIYATWTLQDIIGDSALCTCDFPFQREDTVVDFVVEGAWEPTVPDPEHAIYFELLGSESREGPATYLAPGEAWHVPADSLVDEPEQILRISSGLVDIDQEVEVFLTAFHHQDAPDGWSFLAGA